MNPHPCAVCCCILYMYLFAPLLSQHGYGSPSGFDRTRNVEIGNKNIKLTYLEEAYTSEHWLVRIYRYEQTLLLSALA